MARSRSAHWTLTHQAWLVLEKYRSLESPLVDTDPVRPYQLSLTLTVQFNDFNKGICRVPIVFYLYAGHFATLATENLVLKRAPEMKTLFFLTEK